MNMEEMLTRILDGQKRMETAMNERFDVMQKEIDGIKTDISSLKADMTTVKEDIAEIKEEAAITRTATNKIGENFDELVKALNETKTLIFKY